MFDWTLGVSGDVCTRSNVHEGCDDRMTGTCCKKDPVPKWTMFTFLNRLLRLPSDRCTRKGLDRLLAVHSLKALPIK